MSGIQPQDPFQKWETQELQKLGFSSREDPNIYQAVKLFFSQYDPEHLTHCSFLIKEGAISIESKKATPREKQTLIFIFQKALNQVPYRSEEYRQLMLQLEKLAAAAHLPIGEVAFEKLEMQLQENMENSPSQLQNKLKQLKRIESSRHILKAFRNIIQRPEITISAKKTLIKQMKKEFPLEDVSTELRKIELPIALLDYQGNKQFFFIDADCVFRSQFLVTLLTDEEKHMQISLPRICSPNASAHTDQDILIPENFEIYLKANYQNFNALQPEELTIVIQVADYLGDDVLLEKIIEWGKIYYSYFNKDQLEALLKALVDKVQSFSRLGGISFFLAHMLEVYCELYPKKGFSFHFFNGGIKFLQSLSQVASFDLLPIHLNLSDRQFSHQGMEKLGAIFPRPAYLCASLPFSRIRDFCNCFVEVDHLELILEEEKHSVLDFSFLERFSSLKKLIFKSKQASNHLHFQRKFPLIIPSITSSDSQVFIHFCSHVLFPIEKDYNNLREITITEALTVDLGEDKEDSAANIARFAHLNVFDMSFSNHAESSQYCMLNGWDVIAQMSQLKSLRIYSLSISELPALPSNMTHLFLEACSLLTDVSSIENHPHLEHLMLRSLPIASLPHLPLQLSFCILEDLDNLDLSSLNQFIQMPNLIKINLSELLITNLRFIPRNVQSLSVENCPHLESLQDISSYSKLEELSWAIDFAEEPDHVYRFDASLPMLESLDLVGLDTPGEILGLYYLRNSPRLQEIYLENLSMRSLPQGIHVKKVRIYSCENLLDFSALKGSNELELIDIVTTSIEKMAKATEDLEVSEKNISTIE